MSLWNLSDGLLIKSTPFIDGRISRVRLHNPYAVCLSWSPDLRSDRIVIWNVEHMELLSRIDIAGSVCAIGLNNSRIILHTSDRKILHAQLQNPDQADLIKFDRINGIPIGKALESRECILEQDQVIIPGSKYQPPGTIDIQNYWYGDFETEVQNRKPEASIFSPIYLFESGFNLAVDIFRKTFFRILALFDFRGFRNN